MGIKGEDEPLNIGFKVMLGAAFSLFGFILLFIVIHFFARHLLIRQQRRRRDHVHQTGTQVAPIDVSFAEPPNSGLDPSIVASLPKLLYKQTDQFRQGEVTECSVCLATVVEDAAIRVLPNCKHTFHVDCVDMWFSSNTTCPICRTEAEPRVQPAGAPLGTQVQPTAPPVEDASQMEKVGSSGLADIERHQ